MSEELLQKAIQGAGGSQKIAEAIGCFTRQGVEKWVKSGRLPRTEWTGETDYAAVIERLCAENGHPEYTRNRLLELKTTETV